MLISFYEKSLLMPVIEGNADLLHKKILNALSNNQHTEQKSFVFTVVSSPKIYPSQLVHVRGMSLPDFCKPDQKQIELEEGRTLTFKLRMCLTMRRCEKKPDGTSKNVEFYVKPSECEPMLSKLLERHGFELKKLVSYSNLKIDNVSKADNRSFNVPHTDITFSATVIDGYKAALAYVGGIGRKKVFGAGMLSIEK